jgi:hypothetical protein
MASPTPFFTRFTSTAHLFLPRNSLFSPTSSTSVLPTIQPRYTRLRLDQYHLAALSLAIVALFAKRQLAIAMSDSIHDGLQVAPFEDVDSIDWTALQDEVMQEPWFQLDDDYDWTGCGMLDLGAEALPGVG